MEMYFGLVGRGTEIKMFKLDLFKKMRSISAPRECMIILVWVVYADRAVDHGAVHVVHALHDVHAVHEGTAYLAERVLVGRTATRETRNTVDPILAF